jgi:hypothetical protein
MAGLGLRSVVVSGFTADMAFAAVSSWGRIVMAMRQFLSRRSGVEFSVMRRYSP